MYDFVIYMFQSGLCLAGFYLVYKLFLSRETLHRFNRCLLLGMIGLSAVLPLWRLSLAPDSWVMRLLVRLHESPAPAGEPAAPMLFPMPDATALAESGFDLRTLLCALFIAGAIAAAARTLLSLIGLWRICARGETRFEKGARITVVDAAVKPMSWMNRIILSRQDYESEATATILTHERAHIRLRHSWDILFIDAVGCVQWFNPALWLLRREMQLLHEFEADAEVIRSGADMRQYQMLLIKKAVGPRLHTIANCLNHSNLKKRITMMLQKPSSRWSATRSLLLLPLAGIASIAFACASNPQGKGTENSVKVKQDTLVVKSGPSGMTVNGTDVLADPSVLDDCTLYVNGEKVDQSRLKELDPARIKAMNVQKTNGEKTIHITLEEMNLQEKTTEISAKMKQDTLVVKAGPSGIIVDGVELRTRPESNALDDVTLYINGEKVDPSQLKELDPARIKTMNVQKTNGEKAIYITLKEE